MEGTSVHFTDEETESKRGHPAVWALGIQLPAAGHCPQHPASSLDTPGTQSWAAFCGSAFGRPLDPALLSLTPQPPGPGGGT